MHITPARVLIAHREARVRSALRLLVHDRCPEVVMGEAEDIEETLEVLSVWQPDVLLVDWELVRLRGRKLLRTVRTAVPDLAVLVLGSTSDARHYALRWGADDYINKSDVPDRWVQLLRLHCD